MSPFQISFLYSALNETFDYFRDIYFEVLTQLEFLFHKSNSREGLDNKDKSVPSINRLDSKVQRESIET
ncbi:hypothetical protein LCGC14_0871510 [marine sediment metagenome]|uniref:Uncharacterized protein n=1 Tax=marine sediment metagenome TaxID=412755 RepID=A0A0F9SBH2_9ZZZZ